MSIVSIGKLLVHCRLEAHKSTYFETSIVSCEDLKPIRKLKEVLWTEVLGTIMVVLSYKVEIPPSFLAKDESSEQDDSSLH